MGFRVHVDREKELAHVNEQVSAPTLASRVSLVCGEKQIGKSELLLEAFLRHQDGHPVALLDLARANEAYNVLDRLSTQLSPWVEFRRYNKARDAFSTAGPSFTAGDIEVREHSELTLVVDGTADRQRGVGKLTRAFTDDLRKSGRLRPLMLFDHHDRAVPGVLNWFDEDFLDPLITVADVATFVAAEQPPWVDQVRHSWMLRRPAVLELGRFTAGDVASWAAELGIMISDETAGYAAVTADGMPGRIGTNLAIYLASRQGRP
ncbi:hypothetical protein [Verrucosispora sp. WMMD573]|uniref:hypothetical protein n=1 Tax=Verrucosispora sp. WMMD573 TaxID=3015149 RepID=UPI00248BFF8A|nr:hypothetical protein [Verrucosispora sp. WMMD573]WBB52401.1 hypothetical protein O7601_17585 [Verrucosispora sp. WMMD573]